MMPSEPERSEAHWQGHFGTRMEAIVHVEDLEDAATDLGHPIPRTEITSDREGGWNVWIWE